jgi:antibiotic biosynthesis monooxygenase (ABM) superfamily enzyme
MVWKTWPPDFTELADLSSPALGFNFQTPKLIRFFRIFLRVIFDEFVKSPFYRFFVIPAKAGIQLLTGCGKTLFQP